MQINEGITSYSVLFNQLSEKQPNNYPFCYQTYVVDLWFQGILLYTAQYIATALMWVCKCKHTIQFMSLPKNVIYVGEASRFAIGFIKIMHLAS
jgi:hypothetical protein